MVRLHRLTGGWPFYVRAVALRSAQMARGADHIVSPDTVDLAFLREVVGRTEDLGQHCRYLYETALRDEGEALSAAAEAVLRAIAAQGGLLARSGVVRRLRAHHDQARIYRAINHLIDTDFVGEGGGLLTLLDPVFGFWLAVEPERRNPAASLGNPQALLKRLAWFEAQHAQDRTSMGTLFEKRVENLVRQFRGQEVDGKLFGVEGRVQLPVFNQARKVRVEDPTARYGPHADTYEVDIVASGDDPAEAWAVEAKHRQGALTGAMVRRFVESARIVATVSGHPFRQRWIVASRGVRPDAHILARSEGILTSGMRDVVRLEELLADPPSALAPGRGSRRDTRPHPR